MYQIEIVSDFTRSHLYQITSGKMSVVHRVGVPPIAASPMRPCESVYLRMLKYTR